MIRLFGLPAAVPRQVRKRGSSILSLCLVVCAAGTFGLGFQSAAPAAEPAISGVPDWGQIIQSHRARLAAVQSDQTATEAFANHVGPAVGLGDAAGTLAAKGIPAKLAKELQLADVTRSAQRLVAALAAWELADSTMQALRQPGQTPPASAPSSTRLNWLSANGLSSQSVEVFRQQQDAASGIAGLTLAATQASLDASQQAMREWYFLKTWRDRVRTFRGLARLCGTWQWAIHNHQQHHLEQKLSLIFPPPGNDGTGIQGLTEVIVLGDIVYLRWDIEGRTQEDSLLFTKEGQRLEGTFVNSQGGWGSISGKRTASCTP